MFTRRTWPALALVFVLGAAAAAAEVVRWPAQNAAASLPLLVAADDAATWDEDAATVFLLRDRVSIGQGAVQLRGRDAFVRVTRSGGETRLQIYAEAAALHGANDRRFDADRAVVEFVTRGEVRVTVPRGTVRRQALGTEEVVRRGRAALAGTAPIQPVAAASVEPPAGRRSPQVPAATESKTTPEVPTRSPPPGPTLLPPETEPPPPPPVPPGGSGPTLPPVPVPAPPPARRISIAPRTSQPFQVQYQRLPNGEQAVLATGGILLIVRDVGRNGILDIEAEQLIFWTRGDSQQLFDQMRSPDGVTTREQEFFLSGDVQIRSQGDGATRTLRADQVYYDVTRNTAVAVRADLQMSVPQLPDPLHMRAEELLQYSPQKFEATRAEIFSSRLPSDPGLKLVLGRATFEQRRRERKGLFGRPVTDWATGRPQVIDERRITGENLVVQLEGVPVLWLPAVDADADEPFGPLRGIGFRQDRVFGFQFFSTLNVYSLFNRDPIPGTSWTLEADYLSERGPALGSQYRYAGRDLFGLPGAFDGQARGYGILDDGTDILGGGRGENTPHPDARGWVLARHRQDLPDDFFFQAQLGLFSDQQFYEQYYKYEFDTDVNIRTYLYLKQRKGPLAWTALAQPGLRHWVTEDHWLPRVDAYALGLSPFDWFTYDARASAGYGRLRPSTLSPFPFKPTDIDKQTGRFDLAQELSLPFALGPVKVVPFGTLDLSHYTNDLTGDDNGRIVGGGGVRASIPFSRLYPDIESELFNLNGIHHKITFAGSYTYLDSTDSYLLFPQLDRLNDDATDEALRYVTPRQRWINRSAGLALQNSPIFDPQLYAIRRLVDNRIDTRDEIEVVQLELRQRWQTKRGFPTNPHIVDVLSLDLSGSLFPHPDRDNFGKSAAFLEYATLWNIGDKTAVYSTGLYDPFDDGTRQFTFGTFLTRPDRTKISVGYRLIDPLNSQTVFGSLGYTFSPKYSMFLGGGYDFGTGQNLTTQLAVSRTGSDMTINFGLSYNAILNNFGVTLEILPNLVAQTRNRGTVGLGGGLLR